ncbi:MAG: ABC transporter ATP-binding protein [Acidobacteria bacterium]|nr:ABC transporter ATP-binding protein [Acidobacteriota bacterium]
MKIDVRNLTKRFGTNTVLRDLSLTVSEGEFFFILGPSGCGKTTLLRILAGFESPTAGEVDFEGESILQVPPHKRNIGMVFQNYALWPHMDVSTNVRFGLDMRSISSAEAKERVTEALEMVHLEDLGKRMPNQLSGGQQQRVALARALVTRPGLLLLDEPLSNLDAKLRMEMRDELNRVQKSTGITAIYVTHDQKEALSMADRMIILRDGVIMQEGNPFSVYRRPRSVFVAGFMGETNFIEGTLSAQDETHLVVRSPLGDIRSKRRTLSFADGEDVVVSVRPESIRLAYDGMNNVGARFDGLVDAHVFMGEFEHFWLRAGACRVKMLLTNPPPGLHKEGTELRLAVKDEDIVVLKREGDTP